MLLLSIITFFVTLLGLASSAPTRRQTFHLVKRSTLVPRSGSSDAASQLLAIAPTSNSCSNAPAEGECATASQAAGFLIPAFAKYGIVSPWEIASVLSLIAFESADFKYNINHFPGRAGQGTRNMQMGSFNLLYAQSIPELAGKANSIAGTGDEQLNAVRALVLPEQYSWGSAAWFLTTQCAPSVRSQMQAGGQQAFQAYMGCVGTSATGDRLAYFTRAMQAFGLS